MVLNSSNIIALNCGMKMVVLLIMTVNQIKNNSHFLYKYSAERFYFGDKLLTMMYLDVVLIPKLNGMYIYKTGTLYHDGVEKQDMIIQHFKSYDPLSSSAV